MKNAARIFNGRTGSVGSGTLIQGRWVITAKHVIDNNNGGHANSGSISVQLGSYGNFGVSNIYSPNNGGDIALLRLNRAPRDVLQVPLNDVGDEAGNLVEIGGYGRYGPAGNQRGTGKFRRAQNIVSRTSGWDMRLTFSGPNNRSALPREGIGAPGDSGGTVLMDDGDGQWYLAGVHRAGSITSPANNYGKVGFETRVQSFKWWIDRHLDPLWRTEIEADPADLNVDGLVNAQDIVTMRDADGRRVPFVLNKLDVFDDNVINAQRGAAESDLDAYIHQTVGTRYGDSNLDRRVDQSDLQNLLDHFTGRSATSRDWATGDTDFDRDVDGDDYFDLLGNFNFHVVAVAAEPSRTAELRYDPETGGVTLVSDEAIDGYQIRTHDAFDFDETEVALAFAGDITDLLADEVFQVNLSEEDQIDPYWSYELGNILPEGLDLSELAGVLDVARFSAGSGVTGDFELSLVPEPSVLVLSGLFAAGYMTRRRRQVV